ncbi:LOW QUALITY PROTEIN: hypothetical protein CVT25_009228 [Psilocybe cyanescens]|uniref:Uncharacterized protein n=1 Tax=Psilocybe cyanescens TaxID=93625 RepID=A0A409WW79_PSICY|nr:LOW QUALITY PROTEIN: hypothetical protein CVT25_009228 [Psilocybe cyanescens]
MGHSAPARVGDARAGGMRREERVLKEMNKRGRVRVSWVVDMSANANVHGNMNNNVGMSLISPFFPSIYLPTALAVSTTPTLTIPLWILMPQSRNAPTLPMNSTSDGVGDAGAGCDAFLRNNVRCCVYEQEDEHEGEENMSGGSIQA